MGVDRVCGLEARILDSLGFGVFVVGRQSRVLWAFNRQLSEMTGILGAQAVGRPIGEVFGHLRGLDLEAIDAEIRETGGIRPQTLRLVRPDGEVIYRYVRGDVLEGGPGGENGVIVSVEDVTGHEHMRWCMSRYMAREVVDMLLSARSGEPVQGREVDAAVLVADMRGFTTTAEGLTPQELFETLNAYLGPMVEVVIRHKGMIDKFTGDGFMAVYGLPCVTGDEACRAVESALALREAVAEVSRRRSAENLPTADLGFAVHWGVALAGTIGGEERMEFTVVGDMVNVAHRVQQMAAPGEIVVTRPAARAAGSGYRWGESRWVRVRGRRAPVQISLLLERDGEDEGSLVIDPSSFPVGIEAWDTTEVAVPPDQSVVNKGVDR